MFFKFFLVIFWNCLPILCINLNIFKESKIVGGSSMSIENAPYMAYFTPNENISCDGSIMNKNQVLTAAHCVNSIKMNNPKIKVGSTFRDSFTQSFDVAKFVSHPNYINMKFDYDVAVITIDGAFKFSQSVAPIALVDRDFKLQEGAFVEITGWGSTENNNHPNKLHEVTVPIVAQKTCIKQYANISVDITDNMVCAGLTEKDACQGDSGGPMTYQGKVAGIVSFGKGCGSPGFAGVYTKVSAMRPWLDTVLESD